jgi:hypothetical protein
VRGGRGTEISISLFCVCDCVGDSSVFVFDDVPVEIIDGFEMDSYFSIERKAGKERFCFASLETCFDELALEMEVL